MKESLIPLLEAMAVPPEPIKNILNQWNKITLLNWEQISSTQSFWFEVHSYKDACGENRFVELAGFAMSMLVLPYSNAEVERTFSQLDIVKSKLSNKLKPETTNAILVVRAVLKRHKKSCLITNFQSRFVCGRREESTAERGASGGKPAWKEEERAARGWGRAGTMEPFWLVWRMAVSGSIPPAKFGSGLAEAASPGHTGLG
ncbi:hypothetical protein HPB47_016652 [Ixodes persulcatus]|uniref:Uncharacterized protein n=1 Tax=Ixodes persulcatus TaxID=34615 RepID=A0AC60R055_IXOPE|nr:hypothetical protein HPB47_016652 [Ixodes persulcatus]